jgi:NTP pyrophosphatase (non-canonical NTP hydrolase)
VLRTITAGEGQQQVNDLATLQAGYLAARQHTVNQDTPCGQAAYVLGEAAELAVACKRADALNGWPAFVRHEIADVVLAVVTLANMLDLTVEDCIAEKTEHDRGRG